MTVNGQTTTRRSSSSVSPPDGDDAGVNLNETMQQLETYIEALKTQGAGLPSQVDNEAPHFRAISAASGINFRHLTKEPYRQRVLLAVEEIGLINNEDTQASRREANFIQNHAKLDNYLRWLKDAAFKLPEDPMHRGRVFLAQVAIEAGITTQALVIRKPGGERSYNIRLQQSVEKAVSSLGLEVRVLPQSPGDKRTQFTYGQLLEMGTEERKKELTNCSSAAAQLSNTRYALNLFLEVLRLEETALIGHEFVVGFDISVDEVMGKIDNAYSRKKFRTEIYRWQNIYQRLLKVPSIPDDIHEAIVHLVDRSGLSISVLDKLIGVKSTALWEWYRGKATPDQQSIKPLGRMESLFKLPAGTLVNKIPRGRAGYRFRRSELPPFLRENPKLFYRVSKHLPDDFCDLTLEVQEKIVESIQTDILRSDDDYTRRLRVLMLLPYRLEEWPGQLCGEFDAFADFKMATRPPLGMRRSGTWKSTTKENCENELAHFFGALCLSADADDVRVRGLGMPESQLTLALIACPLIVDWYIRFRCTARTQYTVHAIAWLKTFISMLKPGTGWLRQSPHLAARLRPLLLDETHYVPEDLVSRAQVDWQGVCDAAIEEYKKLIVEIKPLVTVARDPFQRIEGILNMKDPMEPLGLLIQEMKKALPNRHTQPVLYHTAIRDLLLVMLIVLTGLRRGTIAKLNYTGDKTGQLYLDDGGYVLSVPRGFFKVPDSSFFGPTGNKKDYLNRLKDKYGFYKVLKEYLNESRPFLLNEFHRGHSNEQALFISTVKGRDRTDRASARLSERRISAIYADNVEMHLVENKYRGTGIPNVKRTGPHSVRYVRGTKIYRKTKSFKLAGDANQNSEGTARKHYSLITNEEVNLEVNEILFDDDE